MFMLANTISPVFAAGVCHLIGLNLLIALVEAWMIRSAAELRWRAVYWRVLGANIVSAFVGIFAVEVFGAAVGSVWVPEGFPTHGVGAYLLAMIGSMLVLTLVVEVPVVLCLFRKADAVRLRQIAVRFALANAVTYVLLAFVYWNMMPFELPKGLTMASTSAVARDPDARLFWMDQEGAVFERRLGVDDVGTRVGRLDSWRYPLELRFDSTLTLWELSRHERQAPIASGPREGTQLPHDLNDRYGRHVDLQSKPNYPIRVIRRHREITNRGATVELPGADGTTISRAFSLFMPGLVRRFDVQVVLPDEQIILAVDDHLYLYDVRENRLAYLAEGRSAVVVPSARPAQ